MLLSPYRYRSLFQYPATPPYFSFRIHFCTHVSDRVLKPLSTLITCEFWSLVCTDLANIYFPSTNLPWLFRCQTWVLTTLRLVTLLNCCSIIELRTHGWISFWKIVCPYLFKFLSFSFLRGLVLSFFLSSRRRLACVRQVEQNSVPDHIQQLGQIFYSRIQNFDPSL